VPEARHRREFLRPHGQWTAKRALTRERAAVLPTDDFRSCNPEFREPRLSKNLDLVSRFREVGERHGVLPGAVDIAWPPQTPAITGTIVGVRSARQSDGVMRANELKLGPEVIKEIESAAAATAG
jgi:aryl-alcohol dehydrogenase-like predicted oxidoreductase